MCQMVNDRATRWGGGVARQMARRFPETERMFTQSFLHIPRGQRLGEVIFTEATEEMTIASMIAQEGYRTFLNSKNSIRRSFGKPFWEWLRVH